MADTHASPPPAAGGGGSKPAGGGKKGLPWGVILFIVLLAFAISFAADTLFGSRNSIEWLNDFIRRLVGTGLIIVIVVIILKKINS